MALTLLLCCAITNLAEVPPGPGLPDGWDLRGVRGAPKPRFAVTEDGALRVEGTRAAGFAIFELEDEVGPETGALTWRWRTDTALEGADLRDRRRDDSPIRLMVAFEDRRMLFYSWGMTELAGEWFESWTGSERIVIVLRNAVDADGAWRSEQRDPFADYRSAFGREPSPIVAVGLVQDTEQLGGKAWAEVGEIAWAPGS